MKNCKRLLRKRLKITIWKMDSYIDEETRKQIAAIKIQSVFRGYNYRYKQSLKNLYHNSAKIIQRTWRSYKDRRCIQRVTEILALFRLNRAFRLYRLRHHSRKVIERLHQFDDLLGFYPAKSNPPIPKPKPVKKKMKKRGGKKSGSSFLKRNNLNMPKTKSNIKKKDSSKEISDDTLRRPPTTYGGPPRARVSLTPKKPVKKKKIIIELPPPWHNKNVRKLSQGQQDDMMYYQKENFNWAKKELIPLLFRHCRPLFNCRDELRKRNQGFMERIVTKNFFCPITRTIKSINIKIPKAITFIGQTKNMNDVAQNGCAFVVASSVGYVIVEPKSLTADNIISHALFNLKSPLLDVAISPITGQVVGIDSFWMLHLFEHERTILTYDLSPHLEVKLPKSGNYLVFDRFGLLWVNLFPQKGSMLLMDTLTLQPTIYLNLDNLSTVHRFMRTNISMIPLYFKDKPYGFIGTFSSFPEIYIFSLDFQKFKKLSHPKMQCNPSIKQANQRIYIWSKECFIYVYELNEIIDFISQIAIIEINSPPTDICATSDPDMLYISCEDHTVHAILGKTTQHPLRLSTARMDQDEVLCCEVLLGPMKFTKSRNQYQEVAVYKFAWMPTKMSAAVYSDKLTLVIVAFEDSSVSSVWFVIDAQTCKCIDFDSFKYSKPEFSLTLASSNFNDHVIKVQKKRDDFLSKLAFFDKIDETSNTALMNNMFNPSKGQFGFSQFFLSVDLRKVFSFIPDMPPKTISAYQLYHYLYRIGQLPIEISTFPSFLEKFAPTEMKRVLPTEELITNPRFPVKTTGFYSSMVNFTFDSNGISDVFDAINPYSCLKADLGKYTLTSIAESIAVKHSRQRAWLAYYQKSCLVQKLENLTTLEDTVKTELMSRVQKGITQSFLKNQLNKMQPVPLINIHEAAPRMSNRNIEFVKKANRNPLLNDNIHQSICDSWSKYTLYYRDDSSQLFLRALHVPSSIMSHSTVQAHFDLVRRVSHASKKVISSVHSFNNSLKDESVTVIAVNEDVRALPLSHYLTIHSYLGGSARLISAVKSLFSRILICLYQLHKANIITKTVCPSNILLNSTDLTVKLGNVYDCQQLAANGKCVHLPFSADFGKDTNPFLPPEYFHVPPRHFTTAFDVWQFGMTLLYVLTGYLPPSYGSELKKHLNHQILANDKRHVRIELGNELDDPPIYPKVLFFYDWLKDAPLVASTDRNIGDRGECFFSTPKVERPATILDLDKYKLLPFKNTKIHYDESKVFIEIISSCLQIDPEKRPTVEQLLCTYPFNQTSQVTEIFDSYMKSPDPNVFVSQFFAPILNNLNENNFIFAIGIISSLLFYEALTPDDSQYSFPLDIRSNERVIECLFQLQFVDKIVTFVINLMSNQITKMDVIPTLTYENVCFDAIHRFFMRFVSSVEKGTGALLGHVDEVIMSLLALYAASPLLRHNSGSLKSSPIELFDYSTVDSACVYMFTYTKLHPLIRYALEASPFIMNSLIRTTEHDDTYFNSFLNVSEIAYYFSSSLLSTNDKQKINHIKTLAAIWQNGQQISIVRLFLDFKIPQKIIHSYYSPPVRNEASSFICSAFRVVKLKSFDPTCILLQNVLCQPTVVLHCATSIKPSNTSELLKPASVEIIRSILFGESAAAIILLVVNDILWSIAELSKDSTFANLINDIISYSSIFVIQIIMSSQHLQHQLGENGIDFIPNLDYRDVNESLDLDETLTIAKRLSAALFIRQSPLPADLRQQTPPIKQSCDFLSRAVGLLLKECIRLAVSIDNQVYDASKYDLKGSKMLKAKTKVKEEKFSKKLSLINEMCDALQHLFRCLCFYWRNSNEQLSTQLFDDIKNTIIQQIPFCNSLPHPSSKVHQSLQRMILYCIQNLPNDSPVIKLLNDFGDLWPQVMHRDILFIMSCVDKDVTQTQMLERYPIEKNIRIEMLKSMITSQLIGNFLPIFKIIIDEMLYNKTEFKYDSTAMLNLAQRFPMRSEAISIILFVLEFRERYESASKQLASELVYNQFIEKERKLTEEDDNHFLVNSSILFMKMVTQCYGLFTELIIKKAQALLESLCLRFSRDIVDVDIFAQPEEPKQTRKPVQNLTVKEMWNKPLTSLPKAPKVIGAMTSIKTSRPATAFTSTKRTITVSRPTTPR
ncbi:hypothetical protein M9Y10_005146 [Tritrichomonas musculus]|uniref:non-specific serine/threonine protein kinase n=1 Tax=Tritrichomonas musculus TaxID=1915356 RepID=A0ABR2JLS4_9EUKA